MKKPDKEEKLTMDIAEKILILLNGMSVERAKEILNVVLQVVIRKSEIKLW
jgi:hypothetical protein